MNEHQQNRKGVFSMFRNYIFQERLFFFRQTNSKIKPLFIAQKEVFLKMGDGGKRFLIEFLISFAFSTLPW